MRSSVAPEVDPNPRRWRAVLRGDAACDRRPRGLESERRAVPLPGFHRQNADGKDALSHGVPRSDDAVFAARNRPEGRSTIGAGQRPARSRSQVEWYLQYERRSGQWRALRVGQGQRGRRPGESDGHSSVSPAARRTMSIAEYSPREIERRSGRSGSETPSGRAPCRTATNRSRSRGQRRPRRRAGDRRIRGGPSRRRSPAPPGRPVRIQPRRGGGSGAQLGDRRASPACGPRGCSPIRPRSRPPDDLGVADVAVNRGTERESERNDDLRTRRFAERQEEEAGRRDRDGGLQGLSIALGGMANGGRSASRARSASTTGCRRTCSTGLRGIDVVVRAGHVAGSRQRAVEALAGRAQTSEADLGRGHPESEERGGL